MELSLSCLVVAPHPLVTVHVHVAKAKSHALITDSAPRPAMGRPIVQVVRMKMNATQAVVITSSRAPMIAVFLPLPAVMDSLIVETGAMS